MSNESHSSPPSVTPRTSTSDLSNARRPRRRWRRFCAIAVAVVGAAAAVTAAFFSSRYSASDEMLVKVSELATFDYPEDPSARSPHYAQYNGRRLRLIHQGDSTYDFVFEPSDAKVARVVFKGVDVSLLTPGLPEYAAEDDGLRRVALTDREWNRQQVQFHVGRDNIEVTGGDGFEVENLKVASLAKNCLNAGLWEVLLFTTNESGKQMYYQGWFTFPLGHYKRIWEANTGLSYWEDLNFWRMEHWCDPAGNLVPVEKLRQVITEQAVDASFDPNEPVLFSGEQVRKRRTCLASNVRTWGDIVQQRNCIRFASFTPPGRYDVDRPWENRFGLLANFSGATLRRVESKLNGRELDEIELRFKSKSGETSRLFIGGVDLLKAPQLSSADYPSGLYLPMGIGTPPFYQDYAELVRNPPQENPYYAFVLDEENAWIDHHSMAVDGPVLHRDAADPDLLHVYLLSYERHLLVAHFEVPLRPVDVMTASTKSHDRLK